MLASITDLATFAARLDLAPADAIALPSAVTVAARKLDVSESELLALCADRPALGEYIAQACRKVVAPLRG